MPTETTIHPMLEHKLAIRQRMRALGDAELARQEALAQRIAILHDLLHSTPWFALRSRHLIKARIRLIERMF